MKTILLDESFECLATLDGTCPACIHICQICYDLQEAEEEYHRACQGCGNQLNPDYGLRCLVCSR